MASSEDPTTLGGYINSRKRRNWGLVDKQVEKPTVHTKTLTDQKTTQDKCLRCYSLSDERLFASGDNGYLNTNSHKGFCRKALDTKKDSLPYYFASMDASRTWFCYWNVHSLKVLNQEAPNAESIFSFLKHCYNEKTGGFGGGPGQLSHMAPTYSATNCLVELDIPEVFDWLLEKRESLAKFLMSMKQADGSFRMHANGEWDTRSAYCAISTAKLCKLDDLVDFSGTFEWLMSCQTYEGGFSGIPYGEAHGGYTFCGLAALVLLDQDRCRANQQNMKKLTKWLALRQMTVEGGYSGRSNKLVDVCYSFWQGACPRILQNYVFCTDQKLYNDTALAAYTLACSEVKRGGFQDKPGKGPDYYHTCYGLSGYALTDAAQKDSLPTLNPLHNVLQKYVDIASAKLSLDSGAKIIDVV